MILLEFITNHALLTSIFVLLLVLLIISEIRIKKASAITVTAQQATAIINKEDALILDLRDEAAFKQGHIVGSRHMLPTALFADEKFLKQKDKPILLVCQAGHQSLSVGRQLRKQGFTQLYHLKGGVDNWVNAGLLLTKGK